MKKLLFVISQFFQGGAETSLCNLLSELSPKEYDCDLLILDQVPQKDAVSLIPSLPKWVRVCDAYKKSRSCRLLRKVKGKVFYNSRQRKNYPIAALDFAKRRVYDWAFAVGEWSDPAFVAQEVMAKRKAVWIHNDLSLCTYFDEESYFCDLDRFDLAIFVSEESKKKSLEKYPFLKEKSRVIHNINQNEKIRSLAKEKILLPFSSSLPLLVTCANLREQKNHLRQVEVMAELKKRGVCFDWVNIGAMPDKILAERVQNYAKECGVSEHFHLLGAKSNPYPYLAVADAVCVLSDYESWSMVITESKILGTPVIATRTSGAIEQIRDGENGILTDFTVSDIADKIERFLSAPKIGESIRKNLYNFDDTKEILASFDALLSFSPSEKKEILYVIDDINYVGGAHVATKNQIRELQKAGKSVSIFSINSPSVRVREELSDVRFLSWYLFREDDLYNRRLFGVLFDRRFSFAEKRYKFFMSLRSKLRIDKEVFRSMVALRCIRLFSEFDTVCVISEGSEFKEYAAKSTARRKIQWIHTDYCRWRLDTPFAKERCKNDGENWKSFDKIVVLTQGFKNSLSALYPHLSEKITVVKNLLPVERILAMKEIRNAVPLHFVTVGSLEPPKAYERLLPILSRLYGEGYQFDWKIFGKGPELGTVQRLIFEGGLQEAVTLEGVWQNPFRLIRDADVFALLSVREGLPNSIYEALILGVPVLATDVGGISEQVKTGETGWLVENDSESIYLGIRHLLEHPEVIPAVKEKLKSYRYDNESVRKNILSIFDKKEKE